MFIFLFLIIFFSTLINNNWKDFSFVLATFDNYFQTIAIIIIFSVILSYHDIKASVYNIINFIVFMLCLNTVLIIITTIFDLQFINKLYELNFDQSFLLDSDDSKSQSVKARSLTMGRHLGVFNQPVAAGSAYLTAFICWLYLSINSKGLNFKKIISLTLILVGGGISISKVFILGLPFICFLYFTFSLFINKVPKFHLKIFYSFLIFSPFFILILSLSGWRGFDFFIRFLKLENYAGNTKLDNVIIATIEGRFEKESGPMLELSKMMDTNPFFGFGVTEMRVFDSGFFEIILGTGMVGMFLFLIVIIYLLLISLKAVFEKNINGVLLFCLVASLIGTSFGGNAFQLNRSSSILLIVILTFLTIVKTKHKRL